MCIRDSRNGGQYKSRFIEHVHDFVVLVSVVLSQYRSGSMGELQTVRENIARTPCLNKQYNKRSESAAAQLREQSYTPVFSFTQAACKHYVSGAVNCITKTVVVFRAC